MEGREGSEEWRGEKGVGDGKRGVRSGRERREWGMVRGE